MKKLSANKNLQKTFWTELQKMSTILDVFDCAILVVEVIQGLISLLVQNGRSYDCFRGGVGVAV